MSVYAVAVLFATIPFLIILGSDVKIISAIGKLRSATGWFKAFSFPCPPLQEAAGGTVRVHVPFPLTDLCQTERRLGSFSSDPDNYRKEFESLTQAYNLTWHDLFIILSSTLLPEEKG